MKHTAITNMLDAYDLRTQDDYEIALKEILQQLALLGLWRSKFFEYGSFYGGTALRLFFGLRRFSEGLDFSLINKDCIFNLSPHRVSIEKEIEAFGFKFTVETRNKQLTSPIESAFIKRNTRINLLIIEAQDDIIKKFNREQKIKIKLELDTDPPPGSHHEVKALLKPIPFTVRIFTKPDLFAGKMHAVLCRQWKSRVKGRDFYDLTWFIGQKIPCRIAYLKEKLIQTGHWQQEEKLDKDHLFQLLHEKFNLIDFEKVKKDVRPFIKDIQELALWNKEFFLNIIKEIEII